MPIAVSRILFDLPALQAFEGVLECPSDMILGALHGPSFDVAPATEADAAILASGIGVVGVIVGELNDGSPTFRAFESNR